MPPASEPHPQTDRPCPSCDAPVQYRNGIETCIECGWFPPQGAD